MPTLELNTFLERQLEENPCLELEEPVHSEPSPSTPGEETPEKPKNENESDNLDWLSPWQGVNQFGEAEDDPAEDGNSLDQRMPNSQSLHESLAIQLGCQPLSEEERRSGEFLICHLNDNGYLEGTLEDLAAECGVEPKQLESVLTIIQRLDPPGVGARNLRECLMIQLAQSGSGESLAYRIVQDHFPFFVDRRFTAIAKATAASLEEVANACEVLTRLNPKPGRVFATDLPPSLIPDLVIHHREAHYDVELNDEQVPRLILSRAYYQMLRNPNTPPDAREFLSAKVRQASWLIKAIDERNSTLLSIARCLISLQRDFLEQGTKALKPLTQAQVANLVGRHPSTVSRAICGKTIDTPFGIFRLEQLFASAVVQTPDPKNVETSGQETKTGAASDDGREPAEPASVSDALIKSEIQRLIQEEDGAHPLSDQALADRLGQNNIKVARRTIAKYRSVLKILPAHLRRRRF